MDPGIPEALSERPERRSRRHREEEGWLQRSAGSLVFGLFLALIVVAPIPMGGNRDWAWSPMVAAIGVLAVLCALGLGAGQGAFDVSQPERRPMLLLLGCFAVVILVGVVQLLPLPFATASTPWYARAGAALGRAVTAIPSLEAQATFYTILRCLGCGLLFLVARALCRDEAAARRLLIALLVSALIVVAYGLYAQSATSSCYVGSYIKKQGIYAPGIDHCLMSGTFVGSNNFACFAGMAIVAAVALMFAEQPPDEYANDDEEDPGFARGWLSGGRLALVAVVLVCLGGILISGSRAGFAATVAGVVALVYLMMRGRLRRGQGRRIVFAAVAIALVVGLIAGGALIRKTATFANADSFNRLTIWRVSLDVLAQAPLLGWGLGTYADIYTIEQPKQIPLPNDKAHSTPLETLDDLGVPAGLIAWMVVLVPWWICLQGAWRRHHNRHLPAAGFAVSAVAIVHSLVDFSLQMPAIAFAVAALLGMGWAHAFHRGDPVDRGGTNRPLREDLT